MGYADAGPLCPTPICLSPQWFKRPEAAAERMPGAPPPAQSQASRAGCGTAVGAGRPGRGGGARGAQHHGQLPRRSAQPQCSGPALTPSGLEPSGQCAAALPPLRSRRPRAESWINSFPPRAQKGRGAPPQCAAVEAGHHQDWFTPCPEMVQKQKG